MTLPWRRLFAAPGIRAGLAIYLAGVLLFTGWMAWRDYRERMAEIDGRLSIAVSSATKLMPVSLVERLVDGEASVLSGAIEEYRLDLQGLSSALGEVAGLAIVRENPERHVPLIAAEGFLRRWRDGVNLRDGACNSAPIEFRTTTTTSGTWRRLHARRTTGNGIPYAVVGEVEIVPVEQLLLAFAPTAFTYGGFFLLLAVPFVVAFGQQIAEHKKDLLHAHHQTEVERLVANQIQLEFLRFQLTPHFLFNSLNSICSLIATSPRQAEEAILRLSRFCRAIVSARHRNTMSLAEKLSYIDDYLAIEKVRWQERLEVAYDIQVPDPARIEVPAMVLQPLLENAVKHGQSSGAKILRIEIVARVADGKLTLEVANSGRWIEPVTENEQGSRFGLVNLRQRLAAYYGPGDYLTHHVDPEHDMVRFFLHLPLQRAN